MKIIHVIFSLNTGGSETMLIDIINRQCVEGSISLIVINDKINYDLLNTIDKRVNIYLTKRKESNKIQLLTVFLKINRIIALINPDVIHCHDSNLFPFFINHRKKTCLTVHNVKLSTLFLKKYKRLFAVSTAVREDIKIRIGIPAQIIYNGIEVDQYNQRITYNFNREKEVFNIALLSRLFPEQKGQHIAIQSISILVKQNFNIKLYLIGDGNQDELIKLQKLACECGVENYINFLGQKNRQWIKNNLKNYHLLIQPSLYEGFGITILEGFACGLPVISSDIDGPKEIIETLQSGLLAKPNDPVDLAEKISLVYQSYVSNSLSGNNYVLKDKSRLKIFDIQTTSKTYMDNYHF